MGDKLPPSTSPEVQAPEVSTPSPVQPTGSNSDAAAGLPAQSGSDTPLLDALEGSDSAAGAPPAAPAAPAAPVAPAAPPKEKKLDTPFQREMNGETVTLRWTMEDGTPTLQLQDDGKWQRPNETQLRALGYEAEVAADDTSLVDANAGDLTRGLKERRSTEHQEERAFAKANEQHVVPEDPNAPPRPPGTPAPEPTYRTKEDRAALDEKRKAQLADGTAPAMSAEANAGKDKLMKDENRLGAVEKGPDGKRRLAGAVRKLDKTGLSHSWKFEALGTTFPLFGLPATPFVGAQLNSKLGILSMPHEDFDLEPDGLGVKATLPAEVGGEAKAIGEAGLRFGSPYVGIDGYMKIEGTLAAKAAAELEVGLSASDALTVGGKMNLSVGGDVTAALAARLVISAFGFREEIDLGEVLSVDVAKLTWTPAEMAFDLLPSPSLDYSATAGETGVDLRFGELGTGLIGPLKDWVNEDDKAHEKIEALREAGLLDLLDDAAKLELLSQVDDLYTNEDHEASMAAIVLTKPRGLAFIDFLEKAYVNEEGDAPADEDRYETLQDWISDAFMDDDEASEGELKDQLANSYWVLEPEDFKKPRFWADTTVPSGHITHWVEKQGIDLAAGFAWGDDD